MDIKGLIFDKDGTLFDFNATWGAWALKMFESESGGDPVRLAALVDALGYDLENRRFLPGSVVIAETVDALADHILPHIQSADKAALINRMNAAAMSVPQIEAAPLGGYFSALKEQGFQIGVATNDSEVAARAHLEAAGITSLIDFIAGSDSGYGGKPAAGQLQAFCVQTGLKPVDCAMVGDSLHDLHAGRLAGMTTIGVLTGPAPVEELSPFADVVLSSIADIPSWLATRT